MQSVIQHYVEKGLLERLPPSFTAFFAEQIRGWETLFPAEQGYFERLFGLLDRSSPMAVAELFAGLRQLELRMGISRKTWSGREFTLDHVDFLNRSPLYGEWRGEIARIFGRIDPLLDEEIAARRERRLVIVSAPTELPVGPDRMWTRLAGLGGRVKLGAGASAAALLGGLMERPAVEPFANWIVAAGAELAALARPGTVSLSFTALAAYRDRLMAEVRTMMEKEELRGPRQLGERLKQIRPPTGLTAIDSSPVLAEFVRSVLLAGNGTLLINNTFVEWAAVQAARRARPKLAVVSFGVRNKVKPFSNVLIYADQDEVNAIPSQMDTLGSYVDLEVFYLYVWQAFQKYAEYRGNTAYLFLGEGLDEMFVIAPPGFVLQGSQPEGAMAKVCDAWLSGKE